MATPYFQLHRDSVGSTQDVAREHLEDLPVLVVSRRQTAGRGRGGDPWINADRALAVSLAIHRPVADVRPFSLLAGVAAARVVEGSSLKWPNDLLVDGVKVGGILVERSGTAVVVGMGLNLWWPEAPEGMGAISGDDPGEDRHAELGGLWGAETIQLLEKDDWPVAEYRGKCSTIGKDVTWEPNGRGHAVEVLEDGGLVVETLAGREVVYSGEVSQIRG